MVAERVVRRVVLMAVKTVDRRVEKTVDKRA